MCQVIMSYCRIVNNHVTPCPQQEGEQEDLQICQACPRHRGVIKHANTRWIRCQPFE